MDLLQTGYHNFSNGVSLAQSGLQTAAKGANQVAVTTANGVHTAYNTYDQITNPWKWFPQPSNQKLLMYNTLYSATTNPFFLPNYILESYAKK